MRRGAKVAGAHTVSYLRSRESGTDARFGFIVSKKVGTAVRRNLVRRRLKAVCHEALVDGVRRRRRGGAGPARCRRGRVGRAARRGARGVHRIRRRPPAREGSLTCAISPCSWCSSPATPGCCCFGPIASSSRRSTATSAGTTRRARPTDSVRCSSRVSLVGSALTAWRIVRCNPWTAGGIDDVRAARHDRYRITTFGWVVPKGMFPKAEADAAAARLAHELEHQATTPTPASPATRTCARSSPSRRPRTPPPSCPERTDPHPWTSSV